MAVQGLNRRIRHANVKYASPKLTNSKTPATKKVDRKEKLELSEMTAPEAREIGKKSILAGSIFSGLAIGTGMFLGAMAIKTGIPLAVGALGLVGIGLAVSTASALLKQGTMAIDHAAKKDAQQAPKSQNIAGQEWMLSK